MNRGDSSKRVAIPLLQTLLLVLPRHAFAIVSIVSVSLVSVLYALFIYISELNGSLVCVSIYFSDEVLAVQQLWNFLT